MASADLAGVLAEQGYRRRAMARLEAALCDSAESDAILARLKAEAKLAASVAAHRLLL